MIKLKIALVIISISFLVTTVVASVIQSPVYSKPETLVPLGDIPVSGTTTLAPNDGDTSYSKFNYIFGYGGLTIRYDDLLDGVNPPPHTDISISQVRLYAVAKIVPSGTPFRGNLGGGFVGWTAIGRAARLTTSYGLKTLSSQSLKNGNPITVADIDSIESSTYFSNFLNIADGRITQAYIEVDWDVIPSPNIHIRGDTHILGGHIGGG